MMTLRSSASISIALASEMPPVISACSQIEPSSSSGRNSRGTVVASATTAHGGEAPVRA